MKFFRLEWMALKEASSLMREAGLDVTYFVSELNLLGDDGQALLIAEMGRELYDKEGNLVKIEPLSAQDLGLSDDIGELAPRSDDCRNDDNYFLKRTYEFRINKKGQFTDIIILVSFAKRTSEGDWQLVLESLVDSSRSGDERWIIHRRPSPTNK